MRIHMLATAIALILLTPSVKGQEDSSIVSTLNSNSMCTTEKQALDSLKVDMEQEAGALQRESEGLGKADDLSIKFDVEWETVDVRYHVPEYQGMSRQHFSLDVPQVSMRRSDFSFDVPELRWEQTVVGSYPKCHGLKCKKERITTKVPKWYHKRVDASWDIPEVKIARTGFSLDLPKFGRQEVTWKFDVPRFRLDELHIGEKPLYDRELKERSKELEGRGQALASKYEGKMDQAASDYIGCFAGDFKVMRDKHLANFDDGIVALRNASALAAASGASTTLRNAQGEEVSFAVMIQELETRRTAFAEDMDAQIRRRSTTNSDKFSDELLSSVQ